MSKIIGMSRNIKLEWLNQAANFYISGKTEAEIKESLNDYLSYEIKSAINLRKTREILMNIWVRDLENMQGTKEYAVRLYNTGNKENILLAHWCLMILVYPVFADICCTIGKMYNKMFDITNKEIKNRMFDVWGERSTLYHSIDKNIKTLKDIGVLTVLPKNQYGVKKYKINDKNGLVLITNTLTHIKDKLYLSADELRNNPIFFPFEYDITLNILEESQLFMFDKFGGEVVVSRRE
ncbi:hypothetical protein [Proteiniborus sp.]|uniref:hypothetical protein n=1 Tax=Proteiniborus sp. TaxID=2079015 RepID=UPI0033322C3E